MSTGPLAPGKDRWRILAVLLGLALLCLAAYGNTLSAPFVYDDVILIRGNPHLRMRSLSLSSLADVLRSHSINRPAAVFSFAFNYYLGRYHVAGYHLVNWLIHLVNGFWVYVLTRQTLRLLREDLPAAPFLAAALWLSNPVHTQSITYIIQRMNSLAALFYLTALVLYIRARTIPPGHPRRRAATVLLFVGSALSGIAAMASKEIAIILPVMIFLYEWFFIRDLEPGFARKQAPWLYAMAALVTVIIFIYLKGDPIERILATYKKQPFTMGQRLLTQPRVIFDYLSLLLLPLPERLNFDHIVTASRSLTSPPSTAIALGLLFLMTAMAVRKAGSNRLLSFAILWFLGNLAVESSIIGLAMMLEHRTYLPSVFLFMAIACGILKHVRPGWLAMGTLALLIMVSAFWTRQRNSVWTDEIRLWQDTIKKTPDSIMSYNNLGIALTLRGQNEAGLAACRKSIALSPPVANTANAYNNIARIYHNLGDREKCIEYSRRAIEIDPTMAESYLNLGETMLEENRLDEAITDLEAALRINPWLTPAYTFLAKAYYRKTGDVNKPVDICRRAMTMDPDSPEAESLLGSLLLSSGDPRQGLFHLRQALHRFPAHPEANLNAGIVLNKLDQPEAAIPHLTLAVDAMPDHAEARRELGSALMAVNRLDEAREQLLRSLDLSPDDPAVLTRLGTISQKQGRLTEAVYYYRKARAIAADSPELLHQLAVALADSGQLKEAVATLQQLEKLLPDAPTVTFNLACLYARQHQPDKALDQLEKAVSKGFHNREALRTDPDLEAIRNTPRYNRLINSQGE